MVLCRSNRKIIGGGRNFSEGVSRIEQHISWERAAPLSERFLLHEPNAVVDQEAKQRTANPVFSYRYPNSLNASVKVDFRNFSMALIVTF
jgi:hypothetical protein